jgi:hypothetical protein
MEIREKISEINALQKRIESLKEFLRLCEIGDSETEYKDPKGNPKKNMFCSMSVASYRWTGHDNPRLDKLISHEDDISLLVDFIKEPLSIQINKLTKELEDKLN